MLLDDYFDTSLLNLTVEEMMLNINEIIEEIAPEGKTGADFTGGYIQQLKNSSQFVAYFGTKKNTKNRDTVKLTIEANELDSYYMALKLKIQEMHSGTKTKKIMSMAERNLRRAAERESKSEKTSVTNPFTGKTI